MTAIHGTSELAVSTVSGGHVSRFVKRCWRALQERRERAQLRAILHGLGDRELKDMGLAPLDQRLDRAGFGNNAFQRVQVTVI